MKWILVGILAVCQCLVVSQAQAQAQAAAAEEQVDFLQEAGRSLLRGRMNSTEARRLGGWKVKLPSWKPSCSSCSSPGKFETNKWRIQNEEMVRQCGNENGIDTADRTCGIIKGVEMEWGHMALASAAACFGCNLGCGVCASATAQQMLADNLRRNWIHLQSEAKDIFRNEMNKFLSNVWNDLINGRSIKSAVGEYEVSIRLGVWTFTGRTCAGLCWVNSAPKTRPYLTYNIVRRGGSSSSSGGRVGRIVLDNSNMVVDSTGNNRESIPVVLWSWVNNANQRWERQGDLLRLSGTGLCLDSPHRHNGGEVHLINCNSNNANQRWEFVSGKIRVKGSNFCLDNDSGVFGGNRRNGNNLQIWTCLDNNPNQNWSLQRA